MQNDNPSRSVPKRIPWNKGKLTAAAAMLALLLAGTAVSTWQAVRATRAERETGEALAQVTAEQAKTQAALTAQTSIPSTAMAGTSIASARAPIFPAVTASTGVYSP